jgi:hypothetical protein
MMEVIDEMYEKWIGTMKGNLFEYLRMLVVNLQDLSTAFKLVESDRTAELKICCIGNYFCKNVFTKF